MRRILLQILIYNLFIFLNFTNWVFKNIIIIFTVFLRGELIKRLIDDFIIFFMIIYFNMLNKNYFMNFFRIINC